MRIARPTLHTLWFAVLVLATAVAAGAAEQGTNPVEQPVGTLFKWIHFAILAGVAVWLFRYVLPPLFRRNADRISEAITEATTAKAEAERLLKEAAVKLTGLEEEVARFRAQAQKEASAEIERLKAVTQSDIAKIGLAAEGEIRAAERAARVELKALAARLSVERAESLVRGEMTPALQAGMINSFLENLSGRPQ